MRIFPSSVDRSSLMGLQMVSEGSCHVAKALRGLIPLPVPGPNDPRRKELVELEKKKVVIDKTADAMESKEPSFEGFYQSRFDAKQKKLIKAGNFDIRRYNELKQIFYLNSSTSSDHAFQTTSFDHYEKTQIDVLDHSQ
ncbi:hypothetical protein V6N12_069341 [Hibiscus sabdariffa]|uniref:Uncharacterized protein n=1 Tax=Hibiscus sabdariffa TaxID=183260 RepID=A0ABR2FDY7_9ROSI